MDAHDFPLPKSMVDREVEQLMNDAQSHAARGGVAFEEYLKQNGKSEEELREEFRAEAERRVKGTLLIENIAKKENIAATSPPISPKNSHRLPGNTGSPSPKFARRSETTCSR